MNKINKTIRISAFILGRHSELVLELVHETENAWVVIGIEFMYVFSAIFSKLPDDSW